MSEMPVTLPPPTVPPSRYVLVKRSQFCTACNTRHESSELYSHHNLPAAWNRGTVRNLKPLTRPEFNLPIEVVVAKVLEIPFCHDCVMSTSLAHLPPAPQEDHRVVRLSADGKPTSDPGNGTAAPARPKKPVATVDDIFAAIGK